MCVYACIFHWRQSDEFRQPRDVSLTQNVRPKEIKRKKNLFLNGSSAMIIINDSHRHRVVAPSRDTIAHGNISNEEAEPTCSLVVVRYY